MFGISSSTKYKQLNTTKSNKYINKCESPKDGKPLPKAVNQKMSFSYNDFSA